MLTNTNKGNDMKKTLKKANVNRIKPLMSWPDLIFISFFGFIGWTLLISLIDNLLSKG